MDNTPPASMDAYSKDSPVRGAPSTLPSAASATVPSEFNAASAMLFRSSHVTTANNDSRLSCSSDNAPDSLNLLSMASQTIAEAVKQEGQVNAGNPRPVLTPTSNNVPQSNMPASHYEQQRKMSHQQTYSMPPPQPQYPNQTDRAMYYGNNNNSSSNMYSRPQQPQQPQQRMPYPPPPHQYSRQYQPNYNNNNANNNNFQPQQNQCYYPPNSIYPPGQGQMPQQHQHSYQPYPPPPPPQQMQQQGQQQMYGPNGQYRGMPSAMTQRSGSFPTIHDPRAMLPGGGRMIVPTGPQSMTLPPQSQILHPKPIGVASTIPALHPNAPVTPQKSSSSGIDGSQQTSYHRRVKVCSNCFAINSPQWRRIGSDGRLMCNACGLYYKTHRSNRSIPPTLKRARPIFSAHPEQLQYSTIGEYSDEDDIIDESSGQSECESNMNGYSSDSTPGSASKMSKDKSVRRRNTHANTDIIFEQPWLEIINWFCADFNFADFREGIRRGTRQDLRIFKRAMQERIKIIDDHLLSTDEFNKAKQVKSEPAMDSSAATILDSCTLPSKLESLEEEDDASLSTMAAANNTTLLLSAAAAETSVTMDSPNGN